jgi:hypothetical protein
MCLMPNNEIITQEQLSVISRIAVASIGSQGTVGGLLVAGLVSKGSQIVKIDPHNRLLPFTASENDRLARVGRRGRHLR